MQKLSWLSSRINLGFQVCFKVHVGFRLDLFCIGLEVGLNMVFRFIFYQTHRSCQVCLNNLMFWIFQLISHCIP